MVTTYDSPGKYLQLGVHVPRNSALSVKRSFGFYQDTVPAEVAEAETHFEISLSSVNLAKIRKGLEGHSS